MKIIHFSDPHGGGPAEDWMAYFDKRWVGVFNYRFRRRFRHDLSKLQTAVEYILDVKPDAAVCTGELTNAGKHHNHHKEGHDDPSCFQYGFRGAFDVGHKRSVL